MSFGTHSVKLQNFNTGNVEILDINTGAFSDKENLLDTSGSDDKDNFFISDQAFHYLLALSFIRLRKQHKLLTLNLNQYNLLQAKVWVFSKTYRFKLLVV